MPTCQSVSFMFLCSIGWLWVAKIILIDPITAFFSGLFPFFWGKVISFSFTLAFRELFNFINFLRFGMLTITNCTFGLVAISARPFDFQVGLTGGACANEQTVIQWLNESIPPKCDHGTPDSRKQV